jgi:hypothetical protein
MSARCAGCTTAHARGKGRSSPSRRPAGMPAAQRFSQPLTAVNALQQRAGLSQYYSTNMVMEATAWLCPDQNGKSDQAFWIKRVGDSPCPPCQG